MIKVAEYIALSLTNFKAGDQKSILTRKMPATTKQVIPHKVRQEFINSWGFFSLGRKRMIKKLKPNKLDTARRVAADKIAEL